MLHLHTCFIWERMSPDQHELSHTLQERAVAAKLPCPEVACVSYDRICMQVARAISGLPPLLPRQALALSPALCKQVSMCMQVVWATSDLLPLQPRQVPALSPALQVSLLSSNCLLNWYQ